MQVVGTYQRAPPNVSDLCDAHQVNIPRSEYATNVQRSVRKLTNDAQRFGIPTRGPEEIDVYEVCRWFHDLLDKSGERLTEQSPLERLREEQAKLAQYKRRQTEYDLVSRTLVAEALTKISLLLKSLGHAMQKHFGEDAHEMVQDAVEDMKRAVDALFSESESHSVIVDAGRNGKPRQ